MCPNPPPKDALLTDPLLTAHKSIRGCVATLLEDPGGEAAVQALTELATILPSHFAYEERERGFIERLAHENAGAAEQLRQEHAELLALLVHLRDDDRPDPATVKVLADKIAEHEDLENKLGISPLSYDAASKKWRGYA